jgi:hypothetical protein|tara:strand:+ start:25 stop:603 length:579 start_codon:yes stop_codon:yes gene_type:complete
MGFSHLLTDFSDPKATCSAQNFTRKSAQFEKGYATAWKDILEKQDNQRQAWETQLTHSLQDLSFTYHEASAHILESLQPLLEKTLATLLPQIAEQTLPHIIAEQIMEHLTTQEQPQVQITSAPDTQIELEALMPDNSELSIEMVEDPSLVPGLVFLRIGKVEQQVNTTKVATNICTTITGFFQENKKDLKYG